MKYAPAEDRKGKPLHPGDRVRFKTYPRGQAEGVVVVSPRTLEVLPDGSSAPALAIDSDGKVYGMPSAKGVLKLAEGSLVRRVVDAALARRVAARWVAAQDEDEPHDPKDGVLHKWQLDSLTDKAAWKGYKYSLSVWTWDAATYDDSDEPNDWGDQSKHGPLMTLDEVLEAVGKAPFKWGEWLDSSKESFQSKVKKTKKTVTQAIVNIDRVDGKRLSYEEREHIEDKLKLK